MREPFGLRLEDAAKHHRAADVVQESRFRLAQVSEYPEGEALEGKDLETREAAWPVFREQLALELEGRLFGREEEQRWTVRIVAERGADPGETTPGFAGAGRAEEESCAHDPGVPDTGARRETKSRLVPGIQSREGLV